MKFRSPTVLGFGLEVAFLIFGGGCAGAGNSSVKNLPVPELSTTVGPGDTFTAVIVGERDLPSEYRISPNGSVDFPYIGRISIAGMEPHDIASLIRNQLIEKEILTDPQVILNVKQYTSKKVSVIGQVAKPGNVPWTEGLKLVDAVSQAGWFTSIADSKQVILTRSVSPIKTMTVVISVDAITDGKQGDVPLQAGDTVKVESRVF
jgi:protein involved in polysaccharide export with SLBB domain